MRRSKVTACIVMLLLVMLLISACAQKSGLNPKSPVILSLWHNFGGQMQTTMDVLVQDFNATAGRDKGIIINVTSISSSASLQEKLTMIAAGDPGAPEMPNITTCYPATAALLAEKGLLVPLENYFTKTDLADYLPQFLAEGRLADGQLYVFPFAKSTEVLFLNQTLFDSFSTATGITTETLFTLEGIAHAARQYYQWTDAQTPSIPSDGKAFYASDSIFNLAQVGMEQIGAHLFADETLRLDTPEFERIWSTIFEPTVRGGFAIYDGYSSDLSKTGDIVCSTGSTAGILFYGEEIIYPDNTRQPVEYSVLPYPTFEGGKKVAIQRGSGLAVTKSTAAKEEAAAIFLKWFTSPEQNMCFVASTGYLPVTNQAFANHLEREITANPNPNIKKLLGTAISVHREYDFYTPPLFDGLNRVSTNFKDNYLALARRGRARYLENLKTMEPDAAYQEAMNGLLEEFIALQP